MKKEYRLLKNYQFKKLISTRKFVCNKEFFIYYQFRQDFGNIQIGISVPKKIVIRAFSRNKIKRQIRNMLVGIEKHWTIDLVIMIRKNYLTNTYNENNISLKNLLTKVPLKEEKNAL